MTKTPIAIVGLGKWGRNHVRVFAALPDCQVRWLFDLNDRAVAEQLALYPHLRAATSFDQILSDPAVQAIVIATTAGSHYQLAREALLAGKDVFVEKPMTLDLAEGEELCAIAAERGRLIQVGHLLLFHPAVDYIKGLIDRNDLGEIYYIYSQRLNLGVVRNDENALLSLAPHDISLINYLLGAAPIAAQAAGGCYLQDRIEDVIFVTLTYPQRKLAHIHVSWLDPHKTRRLTIVGSRKMAVFDDTETTEKVRIYDKGVLRQEYENYGELLAVRTGDILIPNIPNTEPLKLQAQHFLECVRDRTPPRVDGRMGLEVVRVLAEASRRL
ncbi:MAG TPA: Gfo/Idh/MocA family oxidoreductase [Candidatus Sumerlaeota bacterium]|nr:Gfo/Idh/MocA family oxidoreductase [Candidatus Sumerlaeota bacterium]